MASSGRHLLSSAVCLDLLLLLLVTAVRTAPGQSLPGCPSRCGDVEVPYPFGLSRGCSRDDSFLLNCSQTSDRTTPPRLSTPGGIRVFNISILQGYLDVSLFFARDCYRRQGNKTISSITTRSFNLSVPPPLSISADRNLVIVTGCDVQFWYYANVQDENLWTGCMTGCGSLAMVVNNTCNGFGCCACSIPKGLRTLTGLDLESNEDERDAKISAFNPCNYAFIIDRDKFVFNTSWITVDYTIKAPPQIPTVLDWSIEGPSCGKANISGSHGSNAASAYACISSNSECVASRNGLGYLCNCSAGYAGNPYLEGGCQDIDECKLDRELYPCYGNCTNTPGSYRCSCPIGTYSDDPKKFKCTKERGLSLASKLLIGIGSGVLCCCLIASIIYLIFQKRKIRQLRKKFFQQNGGAFLKQSIQSHPQASFKIFTMDEIQKATNNFRQEFLLGKGGFGTVYKGILEDGHAIAVKKSIMIDERRSQEFAKELFILSQVNHKNIVKLIGCCLESEVPMLVYEYISNGTLHSYIHKQKENVQIPFDVRLKIAIESAEALRYLHTDASPPILHGDVKSSNILLDENFTPKVSDFGTSILAPKDKAQFTTFVQGTCGYLDPEYMQTSELTDKSDVYSFGVVLLELLTGKMPFYFEGLHEERNLVSMFILKNNENKLSDIIHQDIIEDVIVEEVARFSEIAIQCLRLSGEDRPSMKEVVTMLERLYKPKLYTTPNVQGVQKSMEGQYIFNSHVVDNTTEEAQSLFIVGGR